MLKIVVRRRGASIYGNPFYSVVGLEGTEKEIEKAFEMDIIRNYKNGMELVRNSGHVYTVNNKETLKENKKGTLNYRIVDEWNR